MESGESKQLDPAILTLWHAEYASRLTAFLFGVLRNRSLAEEAVQATFTKALTSGGNVESGHERAWLFQVAFREALVIRRRVEIENRSTLCRGSTALQSQMPLDTLLKSERVVEVQKALEQLPEVLRTVVCKRIYDGKTFHEIAKELQIPLGTALTRMRSALKQLQLLLKRNHDD